MKKRAFALLCGVVLVIGCEKPAAAGEGVVAAAAAGCNCAAGANWSPDFAVGPAVTFSAAAYSGGSHGGSHFRGGYVERHRVRHRARLFSGSFLSRRRALMSFGSAGH